MASAVGWYLLTVSLAGSRVPCQTGSFAALGAKDGSAACLCASSHLEQTVARGWRSAHWRLGSRCRWGRGNLSFAHPCLARPLNPCAVQVAGLVPCYLPLGPDFLPRLDTIPPADLARAKVLLLNYPNNPTAATATVEFFQAAVDLCNAHGILLVHDNPYLDLVGTALTDCRTCCPIVRPGVATGLHRTPGRTANSSRPRPCSRQP